MFKMAVLVALLALAACGTAEAKVIPPCTPVEGSDVDPCEQNVPHLAYPEFYLGQKLVIGGDGPERIRSPFFSGFILAQFVVRATYLPGTVRCVAKDHFRFASDAAEGRRTDDKRDPSKFYLGIVQCFVDIRVNDYIVGKGPSRLSVVLREFWYKYEFDTAERIEEILAAYETAYNSGGAYRVGSSLKNVEAPPGGILGREYIHFLCIAHDHSVEGLESFWTWDVERASDGTILVAHPRREFWQSRSETYKTQRRALVEMPLDAFISEVQLEHQNLVEHRKRNPGLEEYRLESYYRMLSSVDELHQFYVDLGATANPFGPPLPPPPVSGGGH